MSSILLLTPDFFENLDFSSEISCPQRKRLPCFANISDHQNDVKPWIISPEVPMKAKCEVVPYVIPHRRKNSKSTLTNESMDSDIHRFKITDELAAKLIGPHGREITKIRRGLKKFATVTTVNIDNWRDGEDRTVTVRSSSKYDRKKAVEMINRRLNA